MVHRSHVSPGHAQGLTLDMAERYVASGDRSTGLTPGRDQALRVRIEQVRFERFAFLAVDLLLIAALLERDGELVDA